MKLLIRSFICALNFKLLGAMIVLEGNSPLVLSQRIQRGPLFLLLLQDTFLDIELTQVLLNTLGGRFQAPSIEVD